MYTHQITYEKWSDTLRMWVPGYFRTTTDALPIWVGRLWDDGDKFRNLSVTPIEPVAESQVFDKPTTLWDTMYVGKEREKVK